MASGPRPKAPPTGPGRNDLYKLAAHAAAPPEIVLVVKQGGHPFHLVGKTGPHFQLVENRRGGLLPATRYRPG